MAKQIVDVDLEWEADEAGVIHLRRHHGQTQFLEGYGTTDFGVSPYEEKSLLNGKNLFLSALAVGGIAAWKYRDRILPGASTLASLALLWRESLRKD